MVSFLIYNVKTNLKVYYLVKSLILVNNVILEFVKGSNLDFKIHKIMVR